MEPDQTATEQTSPRGNDWEVVQLTASTYASAPGPRSSDLSEEAEGKEYGAKMDDSAAALLMSGHFSMSQTEVETLLKSTDSKERLKELCSQDEVSNECHDEQYQETCNHKVKDDTHSIGKSLSLVGVDFDESKVLHGLSLAGEEPAGFLSSGHGAIDAERELSCSATRSKNEKKPEEPTLQNMSIVTGSSKDSASGEQNKLDVWWRKQFLSFYKNAKESNKFWPIFVATTALVGMAYFGRCWQKGRLRARLVDVLSLPTSATFSHILSFARKSGNIRQNVAKLSSNQTNPASSAGQIASFQ